MSSSLISSWYNGEPADSLPIQDRAVSFGDGLFETIKVELQNQAKVLDLESEKIEKKFPDKIEKISKNTFKESE